MKKSIIIVCGMAISFCLGFFLNSMMDEESQHESMNKQSESTSEMKKVTGIGGIFFKCHDPEKLKEWYKTHLGFNSNDFGYRFEFRMENNPTQKMGIQWSPFPEKTNYFAPSNKAFMINYSVDNLEKLVEKLKKQGVELLDTIETYEYGKFVHLMDIEGNKIELFEPNFKFQLEEK